MPKEKQVKETIQEKVIRIKPLAIRQLKMVIEGTTPLLTLPFGQKVLDGMRGKQEGKGLQTREKRDFEKEFDGTWYAIDEAVYGSKYGFPATGLKKAAVSAALSTGRLGMKSLARQSFRVIGRYVPIFCKAGPVMQLDPARVRGKGGVVGTIACRSCFNVPWTIEAELAVNEGVLSVEEVMNLFNLAGFAVGLGCWRPEKDGQYGMFRVK